MNIQLMHIGIDLGLQQLDSKINTNLQHEEKDYLINSVISELINGIFNNEQNTTLNFISAQDIKKYYNALQKFIRNINVSFESIDDYYEAQLPLSNNLGSSYNSGVLIDGVRYKVSAPGTTNFTAFGYSTNPPVLNDEFTCNINEINVTDGSTLAIGTYKILNAGGFDFTASPFNATNNNVGTIFTITASASISFSGNSYTPVLKPLKMQPTWDGTTELIPVSDTECYLPLSSDSIVTTGNYIMSGTLTPRKKYIVVNAGTTPIDLSGVGGVSYPSVGYIFTCTSDAVITWTSNSKLIEVKSYHNRVVLFEEVYNYLNNRFGTTKTSPISVFINNKLRVYHNTNFEINDIKLSYLIKPATVDYNNKIDCDLPEYLHSLLVDLVVKKASAVIGSKEYPALRQEIIENPKIASQQ